MNSVIFLHQRPRDVKKVYSWNKSTINKTVLLVFKTFSITVIIPRKNKYRIFTIPKYFLFKIPFDMRLQNYFIYTIKT